MKTKVLIISLSILLITIIVCINLLKFSPNPSANISHAQLSGRANTSYWESLPLAPYQTSFQINTRTYLRTFSKDFVQLKNQTEHGDPHAQINYASNIDFLELTPPQRDFLSINLINDAKKSISNQDCLTAMINLSYCNGVEKVGDFLTTYSLSSNHPDALRRIALIRLGVFLGPNSLRKIHAERYPPNSENLRAINFFLKSIKSEDRASATQAIDSGRIKELNSELKFRLQTERDVQVKSDMRKALQDLADE